VKQGLTTQQSESLVSGANKAANCVNFDVRLSMNFIQDLVRLNIITSLCIEGYKNMITILLIEISNKIAVCSTLKRNSSY
jgi:hypothetical protein